MGSDYLGRLLAACRPSPRERDAGERGVDTPGAASELSEREREVLRLMAGGASNAAIADALVVSIHTVKTHVAHILAKVSAANRTETVARARQLRVV